MIAILVYHNCQILVASVNIIDRQILSRCLSFSICRLKNIQIIFLLFGIIMAFFAILFLLFGFLSTGLTREKLCSNMRCIVGGKVFAVIVSTVKLLDRGKVSLICICKWKIDQAHCYELVSIAGCLQTLTTKGIFQIWRSLGKLREFV